MRQDPRVFYRRPQPELGKPASGRLGLEDLERIKALIQGTAVVRPGDGGDGP